MKAIKIPTPAGNPRDPGHKIDTIVLHAMSEYFETEGKHIHATEFLNSIGLSCHYMVTPGGSIIECAPPEEKTTWHAKGYNNNSIGIEFLMPGLNDYEVFCQRLRKEDWINENQSEACADLCAQLCGKYGIGIDNVKLHCEIDPKRKFDPGYCHSWDTFFFLINQIISN